MNFESFDYQTITTEGKFCQKLNKIMPKDHEKAYFLFLKIFKLELFKKQGNWENIFYYREFDIMKEYLLLAEHERKL